MRQGQGGEAVQMYAYLNGDMYISTSIPGGRIPHRGYKIHPTHPKHTRSARYSSSSGLSRPTWTCQQPYRLPAIGGVGTAPTLTAMRSIPFEDRSASETHAIPTGRPKVEKKTGTNSSEGDCVYVVCCVSHVSCSERKINTELIVAGQRGDGRQSKGGA